MYVAYGYTTCYDVVNTMTRIEVKVDCHSDTQEANDLSEPTVELRCIKGTKTDLVAKWDCANYKDKELDIQRKKDIRKGNYEILDRTMCTKPTRPLPQDACVTASVSCQYVNWNSVTVPKSRRQRYRLSKHQEENVKATVIGDEKGEQITLDRNGEFELEGTDRDYCTLLYYARKGKEPVRVWMEESQDVRIEAIKRMAA